MGQSLATRTRLELLERITRYLSETGMNEGTFGLRAVNDGKLVRRLRSGANITLGTIERVEAFLAQPRAVKSAPAEAA